MSFIVSFLIAFVISFTLSSLVVAKMMGHPIRDVPRAWLEGAKNMMHYHGSALRRKWQ